MLSGEEVANTKVRVAEARRDGNKAVSDTIGRAIAKSCSICRHCENLGFVVNDKITGR